MYRFQGGTRTVSEMGAMGVAQMLAYVHHHWSPVQATGKEEGKNKERALQLLSQAQGSVGLEALGLVHEAARWMPMEEKVMVVEVEKRQVELCADLAIEMGVDGDSPDWVNDKLVVEQRKGQGRFVVARSPVAVGEELVRESPAVAVLHHSHLATNCLACLRPVVHATPCSSCSSVIFCSPHCRQGATPHHSLECGHLPLLPGAGPLAPVLRLLTSTSREQGLAMAACIAEYSGPPAEVDLQAKGDLLNLQAGCKTGSQYRIDTAARAVYLLTLLKTMGYFEENSQAALDPEHLAIGALLNHFIKVSDDNCHEICELALPDSGEADGFDALFQQVDQVVQVVGVAIYPKMSLFNNSCDVNTVKYQRDGQEVLVAKRDIREGEEVSDFYGEYFFQSDKWSRKKNLGFPCSCRACKEGWPLLDNLPSFSETQLEARLEWAVGRVALEGELQGWQVAEVRRLCQELGRTAEVEAPHEALVLPGLYLHYAQIFLGANCSLAFRLAYRRGKGTKEIK